MIVAVEPNFAAARFVNGALAGYPVRHSVEVLVSGRAFPLGRFDLRRKVS